MPERVVGAEHASGSGAGGDGEEEVVEVVEVGKWFPPATPGITGRPPQLRPRISRPRERFSKREKYEFRRKKAWLRVSRLI